ncbi:hypothetical protein [Bacillus solimangrovi]|uniref:Uncharacterized protein n=1 Tax=Bacillus solimangrovi TaxID=1305675 RepID=A0A1E5LK06_9BACI|nr:hypothetical protein [Bacillus solimangrovi]OEH94420.1 hypothetical protein BFG57_08135 [Bacillus solimangrovi]
MDIEISRMFNQLYKKFLNENFDLSDIEMLIELVRRYEITKDNAKAILEIPKTVFKNDIQFLSFSQSGGYFAGNLTGTSHSSEYIDSFRDDLINITFNEKDIANFIDYCIHNFDSIGWNGLEFYLRIPQVLLNWDNSRILDESTFLNNGNIYAKILKKEFSL